MTIGVLSLQGDFDKHMRMLQTLGEDVVLVRDNDTLESIDGLIIPGGESTTMGKLINSFNLSHTMERRIIEEQMPVFGTCAGMILLATEINGYSQYSIKALDITVERNAYGRQIESFETDITLNISNEHPQIARGVFIRAPQIIRVGKSVKILANYEDAPVLIQQDNILAASFHPELTMDSSIHSYFCKIVKNRIHN